MLFTARRGRSQRVRATSAPMPTEIVSSDLEATPQIPARKSSRTTSCLFLTVPISESLNLVFTVVILAQGTNWAVAVTQAYLLQFDPFLPNAERSESRVRKIKRAADQEAGKGDGERPESLPPSLFLSSHAASESIVSLSLFWCGFEAVRVPKFIPRRRSQRAKEQASKGASGQQSKRARARKRAREQERRRRIERERESKTAREQEAREQESEEAREEEPDRKRAT